MALQNTVLDIFLDGQILAPTSPFHLLVSDAYRYFLGYPRAIEHLAKMTLESSQINMDLDDVEERIQDIKKYLNTHFPAVGLKMLTSAYGSTPMPESFPGYGSPEYPFLNLSSIERQTWRLQFYLHTKLYSLFTRARTTAEKSILTFFLHMVIIHEMTHVIMLVFSSEPTSTKFHGSLGLERNPLGFNRSGVWVERGESGASIESVIAGGEVALLTPQNGEMDDCNPNMVDVAIVGHNGMQLIGGSPYLSEIASGQWDHISTLSLQPTPSYLAQAHINISHSQIPRSYTPSSPSSTAVTPEDNRTVINPGTFSLSSTGDTDIQRRVEEMMVSVRASTGRPDLVAHIPDSSGLAPGEKR